MVQGGMMLGTVINQVLVAWCPVVAEVFLGVVVAEPPEMHVHGFEHLVHHGLHNLTGRSEERRVRL